MTRVRQLGRPPIGGRRTSWYGWRQTVSPLVPILVELTLLARLATDHVAIRPMWCGAESERVNQTGRPWKSPINDTGTRPSSVPAASSSRFWR